jgi:hypothetical protein
MSAHCWVEAPWVIANKNRENIENKKKALRVKRKLLHTQEIDKGKVAVYLKLRSLVCTTDSLLEISSTETIVKADCQQRIYTTHWKIVKYFN